METLPPEMIAKILAHVAFQAGAYFVCEAWRAELLRSLDPDHRYHVMAVGALRLAMVTGDWAEYQRRLDGLGREPLLTHKRLAGPHECPRGGRFCHCRAPGSAPWTCGGLQERLVEHHNILLGGELHGLCLRVREQRGVSLDVRDRAGTYAADVAPMRHPAAPVLYPGDGVVFVRVKPCRLWVTEPLLWGDDELRRSGAADEAQGSDVLVHLLRSWGTVHRLSTDVLELAAESDESCSDWEDGAIDVHELLKRGVAIGHFDGDSSDSSDVNARSDCCWGARRRELRSPRRPTRAGPEPQAAADRTARLRVRARLC